MGPMGPLPDGMGCALACGGQALKVEPLGSMRYLLLLTAVTAGWGSRVIQD